MRNLKSYQRTSVIQETALAYLVHNFSQRKDNVEAGGNESHCGISGAEEFLYVRQNCIEHLPVTLIEEISEPEKEDNFPLVERFFSIDFHAR